MSQSREYFQHDYRAFDDIKMVACMAEYGGFGYGLFWRIVELLHQEEGHKMPIKPYVFLALAKQMKASAEQIQAFIENCVNEYELFKSDGEFFWSDRVFENIEKRNAISLKRSESGRLGASVKQNLAIAKQKQANRNIKDIDKPISKEKDINISFVDFWNLYDKKVGLEKAGEKWVRLSDSERSAIMADIPAYKVLTPDKKFRKDPTTYLNQKCWKDRITEKIADDNLTPEIITERKLRESKYNGELMCFEYLAGQPITFPDRISVFHVQHGYPHELRK